MPGSKKVIFAALNWGIGHATRSIPLIRFALGMGCEILLLSDGDALQVWRREFPDLPYRKLPSYGVKYRFENIYLNILIRTPGLVWAMLNEQKRLRKILRNFKADLIISDNRYGIRSSRVRSVMIGHQLNLPVKPAWVAKLVTFLHNQLLSRFHAIWVPDYKEYPGLSGDMSHPPPVSSVYYIGPLSRFEKLDIPDRYDMVAVLSGPEPQRTKLEKKLVHQLSKLPYQSLIVCGRPDSDQVQHIGNNIEIKSFLGAEALNRAMASAKMVIARSGYSTVMDLTVLQLPALLIPTPGQTEQQYLGDLLQGHPFFCVQNQQAVDVEAAFDELSNQSGGIMQSGGTYVSFEKLLREYLAS